MTGATGPTGATGATGANGSFASYSTVSNNNDVNNGLCNVINSFTYNTVTAIPDLGTINPTFTVSGITANICKVSITLNITHPLPTDLNIYLISPSGNKVKLTTGNGLGPNFTNTTFDDTAHLSIAYVTAAMAPYSGYYEPENSLSHFIGEVANGTWTLSINDGRGGNVGTFQSATLRIYSDNGTGTYQFVGETAVPVAAGENVLVDATYSVRLLDVNGLRIRLTRDVTSGSGSVGTALGYAANEPYRSLRYTTATIMDRETGLTAGTYYYKLWVIANPVANTTNYSIIVKKH